MEFTTQQIRQQVVELVQFYNGCSLKKRKDELSKLIARDVDNPEQIVEVKTNCALFAMAILYTIGFEHPILKQKYKIGMAVANVRQIGFDTKSLLKYNHNVLLKAGDILHYMTPPGTKNDSHIEFCLEDQKLDTFLTHGGAGRPDNAITIVKSDVKWSVGRPLVEVISLEILTK